MWSSWHTHTHPESISGMKTRCGIWREVWAHLKPHVLTINVLLFVVAMVVAPVTALSEPMP